MSTSKKAVRLHATKALGAEEV